jgi:hypothetical protein
VELDDDQRGIVTLSRDDIVVKLRAVGLSLPYPSGLARVRAGQPDAELVVVERAPLGFQRAAEEAHLSYLDLQGRGRVVVPGLVYLAEPRADLHGALRGTSSPFAPKASRVVRALLSDPETRWRLSDLAVLANLNPGNVHRALSALVDQGVVERDADAYVLADPGSLLEAWAEQQQSPRERLFVPVEDRDLRASVHKWLDRLGDHAVVSGELAAEELAPYLPAESATIHVLDADRFAALGIEDRHPLAPSASPGRLLLDSADAGVGDFRSVKNGLPLASPQQIYVDLARDRGRGREAGEHLRRQLLGF